MTIDERIRGIELELSILKRELNPKPKPVTFTPGPWRVGGTDNVNHSIGIDSSGWIQFVDCYWRTDGPKTIEVAKANARLIAEAPAMFAVLLKFCEEDEWNSDEAEAIIKRVRGQA